jgi:hypothetical protein
MGRDLFLFPLLLYRMITILYPIFRSSFKNLFAQKEYQGYKNIPEVKNCQIFLAKK